MNLGGAPHVAPRVRILTVCAVFGVASYTRVWAFRDVTHQRGLTRELKEYAARLEATNVELARASRAKDSFLANLSHELRTPLGVIIGYQNLVLEGGLAPEEPAEFIQRSTASATRLLRLISDMLDLTRLEAGTAEITIEPLPVGPLIGEIRDLVGNALKFTAEGSVTVAAPAENGHVLFSVRDTGRGVPREQQGLLFRKFMRLDSGRPPPRRASVSVSASAASWCP